MKYDEMGNPAFYLVEECGACRWTHIYWEATTVIMVEGLFLVNKVGSCILAVLGAEKILIHGNSWNLFYVILAPREQIQDRFELNIYSDKNASMTLVRRFQASSLRVFFSWNECHRWWLSWVRSPLWEHHAPARHLCISGQQRQESAIELVSGLESGLYMVGLGLWSMKIFSWQRVWTRYIITCLPFAAGMDETVSDCRSRRVGWSHQVSNWSAEPAANIGLESVLFDFFMRDDQDLGYQWVSCMFLCPSHHLSSLSTKNINQELQLFRGLTSSCSFWSHHFFDSAENFNISWAK